jgi:hypothetical protein
VPQQLANDRKAKSRSRADARVCVPQVVYSGAALASREVLRCAERHFCAKR